MTVFPACEFPLLDDFDAIENVRRAVSAGLPYSLIRLGDGEAIVLSFDDDMWLQDLAYLHGHWGTERVTLRAVDEVKGGLQNAVQSADMVGVRSDVIDVSLPRDLLDRPGDEIRDVVISSMPIRAGEIDNLSAIGARRLALLHHVLREIDWAADQTFCSAWINWELLATGALGEILQDVDHVGLVTSRPELEHMVSSRFDVQTSAVIVPDKFTDARGSGHHVPDRFRTIRSEFAFPAGTPVLVGAGIPGKVYCHWLKESGCIAIDVGSVLDAWVGRASRPRVLESRFNVAGGDRVPPDLQLWVPGSPQGRRLSPRWKASGVAD